eukprot:TRINITY_DN5571_c0_g1_i1.p1 TRINITY_DN5571_c0_g1~~TRINITY_DN5571_c0_g1_i1.p1  ORF type:complete len:405 (-),score=111.50 TRINITY_DN5571_c0_g1_i1:89-1303(-)
MNFSRLFVFSAIFITLAAACNCGAGLQCCHTKANGDACFNPSQYHCVRDDFNGGNGMCLTNMKSCNSACYDPKIYSCNNGQLAPAGSGGGGGNNGGGGGGNGGKDNGDDFTVINSCKDTLWIEGRQGGKGQPIPGFSGTVRRLDPGRRLSYGIPSTGLAATRFWAKWGCDSNGRNCAVGDQMQYYPGGGCPSGGCTPPIDSLFEATFGCKPGSSCGSSKPTTWFDTSQVDGFTIPYTLTFSGDTSRCDCDTGRCGTPRINATRLDLNRCPRSENLSAGSWPSVNGKNLNSVDLTFRNRGRLLGCFSPCQKMTHDLGLPEGQKPTLYMCCPTPNPSNCREDQGCILSGPCRSGPISRTQYVKEVHNMAPGIYTFSYDDGVGLHTCPATVKYIMEFCPRGSRGYPA